MKTKIENILKNNGFKSSTKIIENFYNFYKFFIQENEKFNLTRIVEEYDVCEKHFLDSILPEKFFQTNATVIDVGAGAGFPSIPLKIIRPDLKITMVDSLKKKADYLNSAITLLSLKDISAVHSRGEDLAHNSQYREKFDIATARAVASLNILCEYCIPFLKKGGLLVAYKGSSGEDEIEQSQNALKLLGAHIEKMEKYKLSDGSERMIILIKKDKTTPCQFPRSGNKPRKLPL